MKSRRRVTSIVGRQGDGAKDFMTYTSLGMWIIVGAGILWFAGLRLFMQSALSPRRKVLWTAFLVLVGIGIGIVLPLRQVYHKFLILIVVVPVVAVVDVLLFRSGRGLSFWIRACGFEVCTVFATAAAARVSLYFSGVASLLKAVN